MSVWHILCAISKRAGQDAPAQEQRNFCEEGKRMNKMKTVLGSTVLASLLALGAIAQTATPHKTMQATKPAKTAPAAKSDADIQADIQKRLSEAPKLKSENISVAVSGGVATFTGTVSNSGSKGGISSLAKAAGAKKVVNNITVQKAVKAAKKP